jgi:ATP-dependent Clp protease ATP-binding subunit ClpB
LQVLDDGRLTDGQGRTVDFKNTVIILTSNIGSAELAAIEERRDLSDAERTELAQQTVSQALKAHFRPEFINRLDEVVVYRRLERAELANIVDIQLKSLVQRLARRELGLEVRPTAKAFLAEVGYDPQFGARPLKRAIQRHLEDPLAQRILEGAFTPGQVVYVDRGVDGALSFIGRPKEEPAPPASVDARLN